MREFRVDFHYEEHGCTIVKANTADEAEEKVETILSEDGIENLVFKTNHREYGVSCVRTVGESLFSTKSSWTASSTKIARTK